MAISDFFKRKQGGSGGAGASAGNARGVGAKTGEYIPKDANEPKRLGGATQQTSTIEGRAPSTTPPPRSSSDPNFTLKGKPYKGSFFSNSTSLATVDPITPSPGVRGVGYTPGTGLKGAISDAASSLKNMPKSKLAGGIGTAGLIADESQQVYKDVNVSGVDPLTKVARVGEGAGRVASSLAMGSIGATAGSALGPVGSIVGGIGGGALGYLAPETAKALYNKFSDNDISLPSETISQVRSENKGQQELAKTKLQAGFNQSPVTPNVAKLLSDSKVAVTQEETDKSNESKFDINPKGYGISSGKNGSYAYTQNEDGSISKLNLDTGNRTSLGGNVSSIGGNGSTVSRALTDKEQSAMARSNQMIADWNRQKQEKMYTDLMRLSGAGSSTGRTVNTAMLEAGRKGLEGLRAGDIELAKDTSSKAIQERTLELNTRKEAVQEQRDAQRLGLDIAKAQSEAQNRTENINVEQSKILQKASENGILDPIQYLNISKQTKQNKLSPQDYMTAFQNQLKGLDATDIDSVRSRIGDIQEEYGLTQSDARNLEEAIMFYNQ